ncbi:MAG TPA: OmpA family protein [Smithellaceae bacterium]|nr:OmpA family protein [Smithellaceae bacterium]HRS81930.1 OmpA family protein [Smithellaceae bacterium]HRV44140.1 OmpA family protein [Smithellaceae bacterium]
MKKFASLVVVLLVMLLVSTGNAQVRPGSFTIAPTLGMYTFEGNEDMDQARPLVGLRLGYNFNKYIGLEGYLHYANTTNNAWSPKKNVDFTGYGAEVIFHLLPNQSLVPFLAAGVGGVHYSYGMYEEDVDYGTDTYKKDKLAVSFGYGLKWFLSDWFALRLDIRDVMPINKLHNNMLVSLGLNFAFGGAKKAAATSVSAAEPVVEEAAKPQAAAAPEVVEEAKPAVAAAAPAVVEQVVKPQPKTQVKEEVDEMGRATLQVLFDFNKDTIKKNYTKDIDHMVGVMKEHSDLKLTIEGHTDNVGKAAYNKKLSQKRADAVKKYMVEKGGIDAQRLNAIGYGQEKPVASNKTKDGRAKNRRVEAAVDYKK